MKCNRPSWKFLSNNSGNQARNRQPRCSRGRSSCQYPNTSRCCPYLRNKCRHKAHVTGTNHFKFIAPHSGHQKQGDQHQSSGNGRLVWRSVLRLVDRLEPFIVFSSPSRRCTLGSVQCGLRQGDIRPALSGSSAERGCEILQSTRPIQARVSSIHNRESVGFQYYRSDNLILVHQLIMPSMRSSGNRTTESENHRRTWSTSFCKACMMKFDTNWPSKGCIWGP